jgi:hypothetical protein
MSQAHYDVRVAARQPDPAKGEYVNSDTGEIKVCPACVPDARATTRHRCGLAGLQDMLRMGG